MGAEVADDVGRSRAPGSSRQPEAGEEEVVARGSRPRARRRAHPSLAFGDDGAHLLNERVAAGVVTGWHGINPRSLAAPISIRTALSRSRSRAASRRRHGCRARAPPAPAGHGARSACRRGERRPPRRRGAPLRSPYGGSFAECLCAATSRPAPADRDDLDADRPQRDRVYASRVPAPAIAGAQSRARRPGTSSGSTSMSQARVLGRRPPRHPRRRCSRGSA